MFIEYNGDYRSFLTKYEEKASIDDVVVVEKDMCAVLVGEDAVLLEEGEHTVQNPCDVYFVINADMEANWVTDTPVVCDKTKYIINGSIEISPYDALTLVKAVAAAGSFEALVGGFFEGELVSEIQSAFDNGVACKKAELSEYICEKIEAKLTKIGIKTTSFTVDKISKQRKNLGKVILFGAIGAAVAAAAAVLVFTVMIPSSKYSKAVSAMDSGDYITACNIFKELGNYRDSQEQFTKLEVPLVKQQIKETPIGETVILGEYEQDNNPSKKEPLEWRVLAKEDGKALVITEYCIEGKPYNERYVDVTWKECTLRTWLNGEFADTALTEGIRSMILTTVNLTSTNYSCEEFAEKKYSSEDKVFLLSNDEVYDYFTYLTRPANNTDYAVANGAYRDTSNNLCWWWSRSPGDESFKAAFVDTEGYCGIVGDGVTNNKISVRPVMWLSLE